jgi:hypothetical protein
MANLYRDRWITCTEDAIVINWYYLWGRKTIPYSAIRAAQRVHMSALRGKWRIWGTSDPRYWASLDPGRPHKETGLVLDLGRTVRPIITPDDVPAVEEIIKERAGLTQIPDAGPAPAV